ncbi:hypothetical protein [Bdellovibrio bacteriovorus]|uniref:hypothetical protein n=1 Tax=Bdellovibrio bacteriovorus TaxID=959 RepID=UPI0035A5B96B
MKRILITLLIAPMLLAGCSGEEGNVEVSISSSAYPLIPASAVSCLAKENAGNDVPTPDISPSYFRIPVITFNRQDTTKTLVISFIRISIPIPGSSTPLSCEVGGDNLSALRGSWYDSTTREALIPAGTATFQTDCALYCGGIAATTPFTASGTMEIFGLERDAAQNEVPVKTSTVITIQNF